eukprot:jgi/Mesen1/4697/ME000241S03732
MAVSVALSLSCSSILQSSIPSFAISSSNAANRCAFPTGVYKSSSMRRQNATRMPQIRSMSDENAGPGAPKTQQDKEPAWAKPNSDELPPWARGESAGAASAGPVDLPFYVYLLSSAIISIAAVGSIFEYFNQNPIFGVVFPGNPLYVPILGIFTFTGLPLSAYLFSKSIKAFNKLSDDTDREDGYTD